VRVATRSQTKVSLYVLLKMDTPSESPVSIESGASRLRLKNGNLTSRSANRNSMFSRLYSSEISSKVFPSDFAWARILRVLNRHIR